MWLDRLDIHQILLPLNNDFLFVILFQDQDLVFDQIITPTSTFTLARSVERITTPGSVIIGVRLANSLFYILEDQ